MRRHMVAPLLSICLTALPQIRAVAGEAAVPPDLYKAGIRRVEAAYQAGMERAADPEERLECLRLRYAALAALVDVTYQSTLAWLAEKDGLADAMQNDHADWLARRDSILSPAGLEGRAGPERLERAADFMLQRLDFFGRITAATAFSEENWG